MADNNTAPPPQRSIADRVKNGAAVLGAVAGTLTAVYGVYDKVRSEARAYTATSYNTLAPQINQMNEAVKQLQMENQQLRQIVAQAQGTPRLGEKPPAAPPATGRRPAAARRPTVGAAAGTQRPAGTATAGAPSTTATPATEPAAGAPPASPPEQPTPGSPTAGAPPATTPSGQQAGPQGEQAAAEEPEAPADGDPVTGLLQTVGRTRRAIESLKKVPDDFEKVVGKPK